MTDILGYTKLPDGMWEPIKECERGYIYSAAVVTCKKCKTFIRSMGGPMHNSYCVRCYTNLNLE